MEVEAAIYATALARPTDAVISSLRKPRGTRTFPRLQVALSRRAQRFVGDLADRLAYLRAYLEAAGARTLRDLGGGAAASRLASPCEERHLSTRFVVNVRRAALEQSGFWLVRERRREHGPFAGLQCLNKKADRCRVRRARSAEEYEALLKGPRRPSRIGSPGSPLTRRNSLRDKGGDAGLEPATSCL